MLTSAQGWLGVMGPNATPAQAAQSVEQFLSGAIGEPYDLITCGIVAEVQAHDGCASVRETDAIRWQSWRLGVDLTELHHRCFFRPGAPGFQTAPVTQISRYLWLALANALIGAEDLAARQMALLVRPMTRIAEQFYLHHSTKPMMGALGLAFQQITQRVPDHPAFAPVDGMTTAAGLALATGWRKTYANAQRRAGALLNGPAGDLIPVELIWLNRHLPPGDQDPVLTEMQRQIAATAYPSEPWFVDLDARIIAEGY